MRKSSPKRDPARLHHLVARQRAVGAGFSGGTGSGLSRALVEIFSKPDLSAALAFRGGTALHKLHIKSAARYSEDIDLVQVQAGAIGPTLTALRSVLDSWLGEPQWKQNEGRVTLNYRFDSEDTLPLQLRLKVEINSREHLTVFGLKTIPFVVDSRWFQGSAKIVTYELEELLGTKLRALYQRKKGRDLFDLAAALEVTTVDPARIVEAFTAYMKNEGKHVTRALFERNLAEKQKSLQFSADIKPLLASGYAWNRDRAAKAVLTRMIALFPELRGKNQGNEFAKRSRKSAMRMRKGSRSKAWSKYAGGASLTVGLDFASR
jgi:predicted nucleotidyltransferase component of viral defense system